jgi:ComF family protein
LAVDEDLPVTGDGMEEIDSPDRATPSGEGGIVGRPHRFRWIGREEGGGLRRLLVSVLDLVFPPLCVVCTKNLGQGDRYLCGVCVAQISLIGHPLCTRCGRPFFTLGDTDHLCGTCMTKEPPFDVARSCGVYGGTLLAAIHLFKYHHRTYLAPVLCGLLTHIEWGDFGPAGYDVIVPVPLHRKRLYERGFNQALLLSREIGRLWGIPTDDSGLIRKRWTVPQIQLVPKEREKNVRGAFAVVGDSLSGKRVLLVDDVYTTGATVSECARVLKRAGAERVGVFTLARVVIR